MIYFAIYFALISLITSVITVLDKLFAKKHMRRVPEATLFTLAFIGGAAAEYLTMKLVRHKTLHKSFMLGLPAIMIFQAAAVILIITRLL